MAKKHSTSKPGNGRSNGIFKIAGANFKEKKSGKTKEVTTKLKLISTKHKAKVEELDSTLASLQRSSAAAGVSLAGGVAAAVLPPREEARPLVEESQVEELVQSLGTNT